MRYAVVENNTVINIIEAENCENLPGLNILKALPHTDIGDVLINGALPSAACGEVPVGDFYPGPDYQKRADGRWYKIRYTKKDFLLLCGFEKVMALNAAIKAGNIMAQSIHDLLFASEFIDLTDAATAQMVNMLATVEAGNVLTAAESSKVLAGEPYEGENENPAA